MGALHVTGESFQSEVLSSEKPVLVDFFADWCGPCKMLSPLVAELSEEMSDVCKVVKVNIDDAQDIAAQYGVMSIPTLMMFKNGEKVDQSVGALPKSQIETFIKNNL